jgi:hypothetical protein
MRRSLTCCRQERCRSVKIRSSIKGKGDLRDESPSPGMTCENWISTLLALLPRDGSGARSPGGRSCPSEAPARSRALRAGLGTALPASAPWLAERVFELGGCPGVDPCPEASLAGGPDDMVTSSAGAGFFFVRPRRCFLYSHGIRCTRHLLQVVWALGVKHLRYGRQSESDCVSARAGQISYHCWGEVVKGFVHGKRSMAVLRG